MPNKINLVWLLSTSLILFTITGTLYKFAHSTLPIAAIFFSSFDNVFIPADVESVASSINESGKLACKNLLHWAKAWGWERTILTSDILSAKPTSECSMFMVVSAIIL